MGGMAILAYARQLTLYMPSLLSIENIYYPYGKHVVVEEAKKFQTYLYEREYFPDELKLPDLGQFVENMYSIGYQINDFNINLLHSYESPYHYNSRTEEINEAWKQLYEILDLCKEFLNSRRY